VSPEKFRGVMIMTDKPKFLSSLAARRLWGLVPAAALILLLAPLGPAGDAAAPLPQATTHSALAPLEKTFAALQEAVRKNPEDVASHVYLARIYIRASEALRTETEKLVFYAMADLEARITLGLAPTDRNARRLYGETAILNGDYRRAVQIYEDLVYEDAEGRNREDPAILFGLYFLYGNVDRGILFFRTKLKQNPGRQDIRYLLALLHALSGDRRDAVGHLRVLAADPFTPLSILLVSQKLILEIDR
jgi:thioredoxin-like negative regulator of GroEL